MLKTLAPDRVARSQALEDENFQAKWRRSSGMARSRSFQRFGCTLSGLGLGFRVRGLRLKASGLGPEATPYISSVATLDWVTSGYP